MAGRRRQSSQSGDPSPGPSRRSTRSQSQANSPSIAPLPSDSQGQPSPTQSLPPISEGHANSNDHNMADQASPQQQTSAAPTPRHSSQPASLSQGFHAVGRTPGSVRPRHVRGDLPHALPRPQGRPVPLALSGAISGDIAPVEDADQVPDNTYIWGTRISVAAICAAATRFMTGFKDPHDPPTAKPKYTQLIIQCVNNGENVLNIDSNDVYSMEPELYSRMVEYPREVLPLLDNTAREVAFSQLPDLDSANPPYITVRVFNLRQKKTIRDLNPEDIDTLVSVRGMVTRTSTTIPELMAAHFRCQRCSKTVDVLNLDGKVLEPEKCDGCQAKFSLALIHNLSSFTNKQMVKMQEKPDDIPEGETPHSVCMYVFDANVDVCRPGDRVTITGTYRAAPIRVNPRMRILHAAFRTFIDVMHVQRDEAGRMFSVAAAEDEANKQAAGGSQAGGDGVSGISAPPSTSMAPGSQIPAGTQDRFFSSEDDLQAAQLGATTLEQVREKERRMLRLSADPQLYERLVASMAPNIYGMDDVKKGLLCQLFGGRGKSFPGGRIRGEINCLLVGDPSVSKSQLLSYMHALAPRGMYTSGKGSSATGLTAYVTRDPETNELVLESGALVMSDRGICCIDEFDKMSDSARAMLHETMEQQTVSVAKAGLISTLNARTSVCACANPIGSRYNPSLTVSENINLPPTLLTRFDLIYLLLDKFDESADLQLARHLISLYHEGAQGAARAETAVELIPQSELKEYIAYARTRINPKIGSEASQELARVYASMRADGRQRKVVVATPRQLESLIRLSEAQARMRLSAEVEKEHVIEATRLWFQAMSAASPGEGGGVDQDTLAMGMTAERRRAAQLLPEELKRIIQSSTSATSVNELLEGLSHLGITKDQLLGVLRQLNHILALDERTGVVRARRPMTAHENPPTIAATVPTAMEVS